MGNAHAGRTGQILQRDVTGIIFRQKMQRRSDLELGGRQFAPLLKHQTLDRQDFFQHRQRIPGIPPALFPDDLLPQPDRLLQHVGRDQQRVVFRKRRGIGTHQRRRFGTETKIQQLRFGQQFQMRRIARTDQQRHPRTQQDRRTARGQSQKTVTGDHHADPVMTAGRNIQTFRRRVKFCGEQLHFLSVSAYQDSFFRKNSISGSRYSGRRRAKSSVVSRKESLSPASCRRPLIFTAYIS